MNIHRIYEYVHVSQCKLLVMQLSKLVSEADRNDMQIMKKILMDKGIDL